MDDTMGSMTAEAMLGRRLEAYAEARLSPDLATTIRLRARVLAVAHRRADLFRADAALIVLPRVAPSTGAPSLFPRAHDPRHAPIRPGRAPWQRAAGVLLAASLAIGLAAGTAFAARPAGPLYDARLWAETLTLPADPSARAVAELERLKRRLGEVAVASRSGDTAGVTAALLAYEAILEAASVSAILTGDDVAAAILETGVGRNLEVLRSLLDRVPSNASVAISRAIDDAIARSSDTVQRIAASRPVHDDEHGSGTSGGGPTTDPTEATEPTEATKPTEPVEPTARPTRTLAPEPTARPTRTLAPEPATAPAEPATPRPRPTPRPTPDRQDQPGKPPGQRPSPDPGQGGRQQQGG